MRIEELDYQLPSHLIAERPIEPRDECRLMVINRQDGQLHHQHFTDLSNYLNPGDLLVLNSARVTPARLFAQSKKNPEKHFEILVIDADESTFCRALISPSPKEKDGTQLESVQTQKLIRLLEKDFGSGQWRLELEKPDIHWRQLLELEGHMPLPPYILKRRKIKSNYTEDRTWYQTIYADRDGAIAAPTAGLHFTSNLFQQLANNGIDYTTLFLKVGIGTFQPVRTEKIEDHILLPEEYEINETAASKINNAKLNGNKVIAVGTTTVRVLENCFSQFGAIHPSQGQTNLLIYPPYPFKVVDALVTNFHLPKTSLLALVFAFGGTNLILQAYTEAIRKQYRFFSYGDAMLIL